MEDQKPIQLSWFHFCLAILYALLSGVLFHLKILEPFLHDKVALAALYLTLPLLHAALGVGCRMRLESARKLSVVVGVVMVLAFPLTFLSFYFLPLTQWKKGAEQGGTNAA